MKTISKLILAAALMISVTSCKKPQACIVVPEYIEAGQYFTPINCTTDAKTYTWDMGDGSVYSDKEPQHVYWNYGYYLVMMTAERGNNEEVVSSPIQVVGPAHKFQGNYYVNENCQFIGTDTYTVSITKINENKIQIANFLGGATIEANVSGTSFTIIPKAQITDQGGYLWDVLSGSGTINGNTITMSYHIDDYFYANNYGEISCGATCQKQ